MTQLALRGYRDHDGEFITTSKAYPRNATKSAAYTGTSGRTAADFTSGTMFVELFSTTNCFYKFGTSSVAATTSDNFLPANTRIIVPIGGNARVAAIQETTGGTLYAVELGAA